MFPAGPVKRHRPTSDGRLPVPVGWLYAAALAAALVTMMIMSPMPSWPILGYLGLNAVYTRRLKHMPLVDVFIIGTGFLLRLALGYLAVGGPVSGWLLVCLLALWCPPTTCTCRCRWTLG